MVDVRRASVKLYDEDKGFGFVRMLDDDDKPTGKELFFHISGGQNFWEDFDGPAFNPDSQERPPKQNEVLVVTTHYGPRGLRVGRWGYATDYDIVNEEYLSTRPLYRLLCDSQSYDMEARISVVWEGRDLRILSARFPKVEFGEDDIFDGDFNGFYAHILHSFAQQEEDGSWIPVVDPRMFACCVPAKIWQKNAFDKHHQPACRHGSR